MLDRLEKLSPRANMLLVTAVLLFAPLAGWLGYRFGFFLGSN